MTLDLQTQVSSFERVLSVRLPEIVAGSSVATVLRELYAAQSAHAVMRCAAALYPAEVENARQSFAREDRSVFQRLSLPSVGTVRSARLRLADATRLQNGKGIVDALVEMQILDIAASTESLLDRLEFSVGCIVGPARLIPLVELALLASDLDAYERAASYVTHARSLSPGAPELHDLHTVDGIVALSAGNVEEAKRCLYESIRVCEQNEFASLACSIRAFNLSLAEKLLEKGADEAVIKYLSQCLGIWEYEAKRIASWIEAIRNGEKSDFQAPGFRNAMDSPAVKIQSLAIRSSFLPVEHETSFGTSRLDIRTARDQMRADYKRRMTEAVRGKLDLGRN